MPVLDSTFLVAADRKAKGILPYLEALQEEGEPLLVPVQAAIEFAGGKPDPAEAMRKLGESFTLVPCGPDIALIAAQLARATLDAGRFPGWADLQIAATARQQGMAVVTNNVRHFSGIGLVVRPHP